MLVHEKAKGRKPGILLNELGSENVEKESFADESMIELLNGCICCTIQDDMRTELTTFIKNEENIDTLIIEGTGIANPEEIVEALTHPDLIDQVDIQSIIGLVDASRYLEYQSLFQSSKEIRVMLKQQLTASSLIVVNKIDLLDERKLKKVTNKIEQTTSGYTPSIVYTSFGEVETEVLFKKRFMTENFDLVKDSPKQQNHHHHHHTHPFQAMKLSGFGKVSKKDFTAWLKSQQLLRAKGYIRFEEDDTIYAFQYASRQLEIKPIESATSCLIIIGTDLNQEELKKSFEKLQAT